MAYKTPTHIYTDGGLLSMNPSDIGGTWAFVMTDENDDKIAWKAGVVTVEQLNKAEIGFLTKKGGGDVDECEVARITNIHMEHIAIIKAMETVPDGWSGTILSDCQPVLARVISDYEISKGFRRMPANEANLPRYLSARQKEAVARLGKVRFTLVQGHPTKKDLAAGVGKKRNLPVSKWNVLCDDLCNEEKTKFRAKTSMLI